MPNALLPIYPSVSNINKRKLVFIRRGIKFPLVTCCLPCTPNTLQDAWSRHLKCLDVGAVGPFLSCGQQLWCS